ncbi:MAG: hypothetical protein WAO55_08885 [Candidatus Manganitrophaceae bacterium]
MTLFQAVRLFVFLFFLPAGCATGLFLLSARPDARFQNRAINESSGLAKSGRFEGIFWTHNDSGDRPRIFAVTRDGKQIGTIDIAGGNNVDWEDIAIDDHGFLYLCDIGNNRNRRTDLVVYQIPEVDPSRFQQIAVRIRFPFRYPGPHSPDAEACFYRNGAIYLLTKEPGAGQTALYKLDLSHPEREEVLTLIDEIKIDGLVTAADITPDGSHLAILTYSGIYLLKPEKESDHFQIEHRRPIRLGQAEAIAWDGNDLIVTNEGGDMFRLRGL